MPPSRNAGRSRASASAVVSARGCSSRIDDDGVALLLRDRDRHDLVVEPAGLDRRDRLLLGLEGERVLALAVDRPALGDVLGGLAHRVRVVQLGERRVDEPPAERRVLRARAGRGPTAPSGLAITYGARVIDSTPPPMKTSPSPTAIAWAAELIAWRPEPHSRLTVSPPTSTGSPARSSAIRATSRLSSPAWLAQPRITSSIRAGSMPDALDDGPDRGGGEVVRADGARGRRRSGRSASGPPRRPRPRGAGGGDRGSCGRL